ncbi:D-3-phosphoglycerate dehydrogenase [Acetobacter nitrogenifigens DSM 23921 = NBRC 105050]|uniref:Dehydrogenase n=1 Tax=Acetobacter nitrogenifigens DSM 23921 = NBRC 105050 TaxID=1120919 RepID=A0A511XC13_9PROT|nr:hydroxyacid dehydrogenase [Acetobacter nitrogenifigens]GBQ88855.1 D-3-phosphoglycerate dehydrogenase [Acetobacter nitrogenifigens DSM 23921 = NBRC 105050]GEN60509.1 dehydrogenase [Acetobacter nitrogenifigens DSM 23921 = NBRC 105050]
MPTCFITQPIAEKAVDFLRSQEIEVRFASSMTMDAVIAEVGSSEALITRDLGFSAEALAAAPALRVVACHGSGTNRIAVAAAKARGVTVTRAPGTNSRSVAELTIGLMLAVARRIGEADQAVRANDWAFRYRAGGMELYGKTLGLVGFGAIAREVARIAANGFGMKVLAWSPSVPAEVFAEHGVTPASDMPALLNASDVISLHRPAERPGDASPVITEETTGFLRPGSILLNSSRGAAVDHQALLSAIASGRLAGAGLDVLQQEPPRSDDPLLQCERIVFSPHIGAATEEALLRTAMMCAHQVIDVFSGRIPPHAL